jgi:4-hydroxy-tetrahydrodipicolinate synthase
VRAGSRAIRDERKRERAKFHGSIPALLTPFEDGKFDEPAVRRRRRHSDSHLQLYNLPLRSVVDISVDRMTRLYDLKNIVGVKDASGDVGRVSRRRYASRPNPSVWFRN